MRRQSCRAMHQGPYAAGSPSGWAGLLPWQPTLTVLLAMLLVLAGAHGAGAQKAQDHAASDQAEAYGWYTNHKYGYVIAWPQKLLKAQGESDAGDGQLFNTPDGKAELRCWGAFKSVEQTSLKGLFQAAQKEPGLQVTYKHLGKDFFVVSGIQGPNIVYRKTVRNKDVTATFLLTYATSLRAVFDPLVGDIAKSFKADEAFLYH